MKCKPKHRFCNEIRILFLSFWLCRFINIFLWGPLLLVVGCCGCAASPDRSRRCLCLAVAWTLSQYRRINCLAGFVSWVQHRLYYIWVFFFFLMWCWWGFCCCCCCCQGRFLSKVNVELLCASYCSEGNVQEVAYTHSFFLVFSL